MDPKRYSWGSFQAAGGESRHQRSTFKDYIWFLIGAFVFCGLIVGGLYMMIDVRVQHRREQRAQLIEMVTGERVKTASLNEVWGRTKVAGLVGGVIGVGLGLIWALSCMAKEKHEEELRKGRQQLEAGRFRSGFKVE